MGNRGRFSAQWHNRSEGVSRFLPWAFPVWHTSQRSSQSATGGIVAAIELALAVGAELRTQPLTKTPAEIIVIEVDISEQLNAAGRSVLALTIGPLGGRIVVADWTHELGHLYATVSGGRRHRLTGFRFNVVLDNLEYWQVFCPVAISE